MHIVLIIHSNFPSWTTIVHQFLMYGYIFAWDWVGFCEPFNVEGGTHAAARGGFRSFNPWLNKLLHPNPEPSEGRPLGIADDIAGHDPIKMGFRQMSEYEGEEQKYASEEGLRDAISQVRMPCVTNFRAKVFITSWELYSSDTPVADGLRTVVSILDIVPWPWYAGIPLDIIVFAGTWVDIDRASSQLTDFEKNDAQSWAVMGLAAGVIQLLVPPAGTAAEVIAFLRINQILHTPPDLKP